MGVATRGVKFKFTAGEKVLCYEPDPTKAKVLYESKVLDLVVSRDDRGRKAPEYLIHFFGWNSSWDRCVKEEFILPYTEENRELQARLANEAALSIKGKRKSKLPPLIKETLNKKLCSESGNEKSEDQDSSRSGSDTESSEEDVEEKDVTLNIPETLKLQLEDDWRAVTTKTKLVKLPCQPNVVTILEAFVKHLAAKLLCASPPRNSKNGKQLMPDDVQNKLRLCKEAMDGIRVYFDFTLPHLLLYRQEKKQYYTDGTACSPLLDATRELSETTLKVEVDTSSEAATPKTEMASPGRPQKGRPPRSLKSPPATVKTEVGSSPESKSPSEKCFKKPARGRPRMASTRILRSSDRPRQSTSADESPTVTDSPEVKPCPEAGPSSEIRLTRKSIHQTASSPQPVSSDPVSCPASLSHPPPTEQSVSTTDSSGQSTASAPKLGQQYHLMNNAGLLQEVLSWHMLPDHFCRQIPAAPSLVYGAHHLLRLLVKLPEMISKMGISSQKLENLMCILENFLIYLAEQKEKLFLPSVYVDACDDGCTNAAK